MEKEWKWKWNSTINTITYNYFVIRALFEFGVNDIVNSMN